MVCREQNIKFVHPVREQQHNSDPVHSGTHQLAWQSPCLSAY